MAFFNKMKSRTIKENLAHLLALHGMLPNQLSNDLLEPYESGYFHDETPLKFSKFIQNAHRQGLFLKRKC